MAMKKLLKKWQVWVAIIAGLLTIASITLDFPGKIRNAFKGKETSLVLSGVIWDENRDPLAGVGIRLREFSRTDTTNQDGEFKFEVKAPKPRSVNLIATKGGYETVDTDAMLGETDFNFEMPKKELNGTTQSRPTKVVQILSGIIWGEGNEPLVGVAVTLPEFDQTTTTSQYGKYKFQVTAKKQQTVNLIAQKSGYKTYNAYATLGNPAHNFAMTLKPSGLEAQERRLQGRLQRIGEYDEWLPEVGIDVTIIEANTTGTTVEGGVFHIFLPDKFEAGVQVTLDVKKNGWRILSPPEGKVRIPRNLELEVVTVQLSPVNPNHREKREQTKAETKLLKKWQAWIAIIAGLLTIASIIIGFSGKIKSVFRGKGSPLALSGIIWGEGNDPLVSVTVTLPDFDQTTTTSQYGKYEFQVTAKKQQTVNLIAQKAGYETHNTYATLGNPTHNFTMERKP